MHLGTADVTSWGNEFAVSWRVTNHITKSWARVAEILNIASFKLDSVGFWGHNDADMVEIGNNVDGHRALLDAEQRSHFALWAAMKSPIIIGADLKDLSEGEISLLKTKILLDFNQDDVYGAPAKPYKWDVNPNWTFDPKHPAEFWSGKTKAGTLVIMLNTLDHTVKKKCRVV